MSAVAGVVYFDLKPAKRTLLDSMASRLAYRGDAAPSIITKGHVGFIHIPQYITPESFSEKLPTFSQDGRLLITSDARLDNRETLADQFNISTQALSSYPDSQLILAAYQKWGESCPKHLLGDFVFAIWDGSTQTLFCAQNQMGTRPFYYYAGQNCFYFASEIKALLATKEVPKRLNSAYLVHQANLIRPSQSKETFFQKIERLGPATLLKVNRAGVTSSKYYQLTDSLPKHQFASPEACLEEFKNIFSQAVRCRMRSNLPVGTFLSGGLDSSAITCIAAQHAQAKNQPLFAFASCLSEDYQGQGEDERDFIKKVAAQEKNIALDFVTPTSNPLEDLDNVIPYLESPCANAHVYTALQRQAQARGVRVILDGCHGERGPSFHAGGYLNYLFKTMRWITLYRELTAYSTNYQCSRQRALIREALFPLLPYRLQHYYQSLRGARLANTRLIHPAIKHTYIPDSLKYQNEKILNQLRQRPLPNLDFPEPRPFESMGQLFGIRTYYPYLDVRVLSFCATLAPHWFFKSGWKRYLIRASMEGVVPKSVQWRTDKKPFSPDYYDRLQASSSQIEDYIRSFSKESLACQYIDTQHILDTIHQLNRTLSWRPRQGADPARAVVDRGVNFLAFLKWFEQL